MTDTSSETNEPAAAPSSPEAGLLAPWDHAIDVLRSEGKRGYIRLKLKDEAEAEQQAFAHWLNDADVWNGEAYPALGSPNQEMAKNTLNFAATIMPAPWSCAFIRWAMHSPQCAAQMAQAAAAPSGSLDYDLFRAQMLESFGTALMQGRSAQGEPRHSALFDHALNHSYITQHRDGSWHPVSDDEIIRLLHAPQGPHVVITGSHAFLENVNEDIEKTTKVFDEIMQASVATSGGMIQRKTIDDAPGPDDTILICAAHTRENNFLNLADLFYRLHEIHQAHDAPEQDDFQHLSPNAARIVATLLKAMATEPSRIALLRDGQQKPTLFTRDEPLVLRPDAADILRRMIFIGFSKGGNALRDALRFLVHELDARDANGQPLVQPTAGSVRDLIASISMTVQSLNEKELDDYYTALGARALLVSNKVDQFAPPPVFTHREVDPTFNFNGASKFGGHAPEIVSEGVLNTPALLDHHRMVFAGAAGKPAVAHLHYREGEKGPVLVLELAPGTTDAMMQRAQPALEAALNVAGLSGLVLERTASVAPDRYQLRAADNSSDLLAPATLARVKSAFQALAEDPAQSIWVGHDVCTLDLPAIKGHAVLAAAGKHPERSPSHVVSTRELMRRIDNRLPPPPAAERGA